MQFKTVLQNNKINFQFDIPFPTYHSKVFVGDTLEEQLHTYLEFKKRIEPLYTFLKKYQFRKEGLQAALQSMDKKEFQYQRNLLFYSDPKELVQFGIIHEIKNEMEDFYETEVLASEMDELDRYEKVCYLFEMHYMDFKKLKAYAYLIHDESIIQAFIECENFLEQRSKRVITGGLYDQFIDVLEDEMLLKLKGSFQENVQPILDNKDSLAQLLFLMNSKVFFYPIIEKIAEHEGNQSLLDMIDLLEENEIEFQEHPRFTKKKDYIKKKRIYS